jgi:hypothetical protein
MKERRYSQYKSEDVWSQLYHLQETLGVVVQDGSVYGNSVSLTSQGEEHRAVVLARSSDWYEYSLNCIEHIRHGLTLVVCGTHDSCIDRPVLALDAMKLYAAKEMRVKTLEPTSKRTPKGRPDDAFEKHRKSHYGHNMLVGALLCGRADAFKRLLTLPDSTRWRIEAEVRQLHKRREGHPLPVWPIYEHIEAS